MPDRGGLVGLDLEPEREREDREPPHPPSRAHVPLSATVDREGTRTSSMEATAHKTLSLQCAVCRPRPLPQEGDGAETSMDERRLRRREMAEREREGPGRGEKKQKKERKEKRKRRGKKGKIKRIERD